MLFARSDSTFRRFSGRLVEIRGVIDPILDRDMRTLATIRGTRPPGLPSVALRYSHPLGHVNRPRLGGPVVGSQRDCYHQGSTAPPAAGATARSGPTARLEAALFVAKEPLSSRRLGQIASLADGTEARTLIRRLNEFYDREGCAFRVEEIAGGFRLMTRSQFGSWLRQVHQTQLETRLSTPALETLAIVAYRQPVLRAAIEAIRGVQCGEMLRQLMERDLVRIVGRSQELGRPYLFGTTKRFLQLFGLRHLDELPRAQQLRALTDATVPPGSQPTATQANTGLFSSAVRQEESDVKTTVETELQPLWAGLGGAGLPESARLADETARKSFERAMDDEEDEDDEDDDDEDDDSDDEDIEDSDWEEVDDEDDDEDDEDEDEDWDDEDDDWDEEDDDDWEDDDDDEDEEEEEEEDAE